MINTANIYVIRWCIFHPAIELCLCGNNSQHSLLAFQKENKAELKNKFQGILPTFILASLVISTFFTPGVYMDDIANIICQLFQYSIKQQHHQNY